MIKLTDILDEAENPCWKGYKQVGMKSKNGKEVPNCVPESVEVNERADYKYLTQTILDAKPRHNVYYNDSHNVVNIGGVGYDKGELVKQFNQKPGSSSTIKNNFYHANKDPQTTKREVEKLSNGKIKVDIQKGYGGKPMVVYILKESTQLKETMIRRAVDLAQEILPKDVWSRYASNGVKNKEFVKSIVRDLTNMLNRFYKSYDVNVRIKEDILHEIVNKPQNEDLRKWLGSGPTGGWDRYDTQGNKVGKCGDAKDGEPYAACLSNEKAAKLGKDGRAAFVKRKRGAQKKAGDAKKGGEQKKGQKPTFVKTGA